MVQEIENPDYTIKLNCLQVLEGPEEQRQNEVEAGA